jgi:AcrR family transcriptional regulator
MDHDQAQVTLLDAAEALFYARGIQAVGMDEIRSRAGVSLKRLYALYPSKEHLVVAFLHRRDTVWRGRLAERVSQTAEPRERLLAVFDWLNQWFSEPGFRGCAWINAFGELGDQSPPVLAEVRAHQNALMAFLADLVSAAGFTEALADQLYLLVEGATVTAAMLATSEPARTAKTAASMLISNAER